MIRQQLSGVVHRKESVVRKFCIIKGDNGIHYFCLPSHVIGGRFDALSVGCRVDFEPFEHEKGLRARAVALPVAPSSSPTPHHG